MGDGNKFKNVKLIKRRINGANHAFQPSGKRARIPSLAKNRRSFSLSGSTPISLAYSFNSIFEQEEMYEQDKQLEGIEEVGNA